MRNVWQGGLIAAAVVLGSLAATALAEEKGKSDLGEKPAMQGESWMGSTGAQDPAMGERRTDMQKNAIETTKDGRSGTVPDASRGESGLKDEAPAGGNDGGKGE
jgi:hypothetical protein